MAPTPYQYIHEYYYTYNVRYTHITLDTLAGSVALFLAAARLRQMFHDVHPVPAPDQLLSAHVAHPVVEFTLLALRHRRHVDTRPRAAARGRRRGRIGGVDGALRLFRFHLRNRRSHYNADNDRICSISYLKSIYMHSDGHISFFHDLDHDRDLFAVDLISNDHNPLFEADTFADHDHSEDRTLSLLNLLQRIVERDRRSCQSLTIYIYIYIYIIYNFVTYLILLNILYSVIHTTLIYIIKYNNNINMN